MIQNHDELLKGYIEIIEITNDTELNLNKLYFEYSLSFICILFVTYEGQDCRAFRFSCIDMNMIATNDLLSNFVSNNECINAIFLLDDEIFVIDEAFLQYIEEDDEFLV